MSMLKRWQNRIFLTLWITYASFYLGRMNFSVVLPQIMTDFGLTRTDVGAIGTALFWAYAIGQFINGQLGDKFGARILVTVGLTVSALMNLLFGFSNTLGAMIIIWAINGYAQSMGWAPIVKTLASWFSSSVRGKMSGLLGTSYILGGAISVVLAGFIAVRAGWQATFFIPCVLLLLSSIHWYLRVRNSPESTDGKSKEKYLGLRYTLKNSIGDRQVRLMGLGLFFVNIMRYGFLTWAPMYLFETQGAEIDKAAYSSVIFPLAGALGAIVAGYVTDRWFQSRRAPVACIGLILAGILAWSYRFIVPVNAWVLGLVTLAGIGFAVFGAHVLIVAAAPMDLGTRKAASSATGFIDGCGYIGAGLQGVTTGLLVDNWGWNAGFTFWIISALIAAVIMALLWGHKPPEQTYA